MEKLFEYAAAALLLWVGYFHVWQPAQSAPPPEERREFHFPLEDGRSVRVRVTAAPGDLRAAPRPHGPDYEAWFRRLHRMGKQQMGPFYATIAREMELEGYELDRAVLRLAQEIPYDSIPVVYRDAPSYDLFLPMVTLQEGYGDCDSKALLVASLLTHEHPVLILHGMRHVVIGLPGTPALGDHAVEYAGQSWLLCETTVPRPIGNLSAGVWWDVHTRKYEMFVLDGKKV